MKRMDRGAKRTIWRMEFMATRMAQYSLSPPARPVQIRTCDVVSQTLLEVSNLSSESDKGWGGKSE